jgi:hypothetical protein
VEALARLSSFYRAGIALDEGIQLADSGILAAKFEK